ncbi:MAG: hypothetical protein ACR2OZ_20120 [Verrucomicrobiales bacterium]
MRFPLRLGGTTIGRTVTLIRLMSGEVVIHSTAPFAASDIARISALGRPAALVEATLFHDTFARSAQGLYPGVPFFAPEGFDKVAKVSARCLTNPALAWKGELEVLRLEGMPKVQEYAFLHCPSRTLVLADLVFNFGSAVTPWTRLFFRWIAGVTRSPGMSRMFRLMIRDREAFAESVLQMMEWDFDRVVVAHGDVIASGGKSKLGAALSQCGYLTQ